MNAFNEHHGWLDDELQSLAVFDMSPARVDRTREACLAALERGHPVPAGRGRFAWAEPLTVTAFGMAYLVAAIQASMVLLRLR